MKARPSVALTIRIPPDLKKQIVEAAAKDEKASGIPGSITVYVIRALREKLARG